MPIIIPPTFYKEMSNPFIQQVYLKTEKILRQAKRIYICGYSLPDADMHISYLLKKAEMFNKKTPEIVVINKNPKLNKGRQKVQIEKDKERFRRFFREKEKVSVLDKSFKDFAEGGLGN